MGMIPRAVEQVFRIAGEMQSRGWEYAIEGELEVSDNHTISVMPVRNVEL